MTFDQLLQCAQSGDRQAIMQILQLYRPLLIKNSVV